jgi:hypothetical protein
MKQGGEDDERRNHLIETQNKIIEMRILSLWSSSTGNCKHWALGKGKIRNRRPEQDSPGASELAVKAGLVVLMLSWSGRDETALVQIED